MNAETIVRKTIEEHELISPGDRLLLGLSGGPDSLCLLHILSGLSVQMNFSLYALHLNHLMRREAADDEEWLEQHCSELGVPLYIVRCNVRELAGTLGICEEEAGRKARHDALMEKAEELGAKAVFAHNMNDQAETVLLRMLRGTGVHGLAAMEYKRRDGVIRPLLDTPREKIEEYCAEKGLEPRIDSTNFTEDYARNRLRRLLIPMLKEEFNPSVCHVLTRLAANAREDDEYLAFLSEQALKKAVICEEEGSCVLSLKQLRVMPPALFKRAVRLAFSGIGLTQDIGQTHLNSLHKVISSGAGGKTVEFPQNYTARVGGGKVVLSRRAESLF